MIKTPTLIVLGAGASQPYGFPLGAELLRAIAQDIGATAPENPGGIVAAASGVAVEDVLRFRSDLLQARRLSIDAFLESRADYDLLGRCAIAQHLLRLEDDTQLYPGLDNDWYTLLFDAILGKSPDVFKTNQLKVITFNFERSFERALFLALTANFNGCDIDQLLDVIPVLHIHGDLGFPSWEHREWKTPGTRDFTRAHDVASVASIARRIRIVHQEATDGTLSVARDWLAWAERVFFIGFSYHELNLAKLGMPESLNGKEVHGTRFRMGDGPVSRAKRLLNNQIAFAARDHVAADVIREFRWFYE